MCMRCVHAVNIIYFNIMAEEMRSYRAAVLCKCIRNFFFVVCFFCALCFLFLISVLFLVYFGVDFSLRTTTRNKILNRKYRKRERIKRKTEIWLYLFHYVYVQIATRTCIKFDLIRMFYCVRCWFQLMTVFVRIY